jgi:hypothetical protein
MTPEKLAKELQLKLTEVQKVSTVSPAQVEKIIETDAQKAAFAKLCYQPTLNYLKKTESNEKLLGESLTQEVKTSDTARTGKNGKNKTKGKNIE